MAVVTNLKSGKHGKPFLQYPSNASDDVQQYYVMFQINVQTKAKVEFLGDAKSTQSGGNTSEFSTVYVPRRTSNKKNLEVRYVFTCLHH